MSVLSYLKRAYPLVEPHAVAGALLCEGKTTQCEDGRFMVVVLEGNRRVKIPSELGQGCSFKMADRILLEWGLHIGGSWAYTHSADGPLHTRVLRRFMDRLSPPAVLETLFMVSESSMRELISTLVLRLRISVSSTAIRRAFEDATSTAWELSIPQSMIIAKLCNATAVATVRCKKDDASFVIDGKAYLKCSPRDWVLLTHVAQPAPNARNELICALRLIILSLESYSGILLTSIVTLPQLTSALATLYPSHKMSSPTKDQPAGAKRKAEEDQEPAYDAFEWREYNAEAKAAVKQFHGVDSSVPKITCEGDSDGTTLSMMVEGCPPGKYNQVIKGFCDNVTVYMPSTGGPFPNTDKLSLKATGEEGRATAAQLKQRIAEAIASATNLQHFVAKAERAQMKKMNPAERVKWVLQKIDDGDYAIPVAQRQDVNDETGEVSYEITALKARSGFARTKKGGTGASYAKDVAANITNDTGVVSATEAIDGKEFSPPSVSDAIGNPIPWSRLTEGGTQTRVSFAGIMEIQLLGVNKIMQKSTGTKSYATIPTRYSLRVCRVRNNEQLGPRIDPADKRVKLF